MPENDPQAMLGVFFVMVRGEGIMCETKIASICVG